MAATRTSPNKATGRREVLGPRDWLDVARDMLINEGAERVRIEPLAERLGVSRGSFYWHFEDREALLRALLELWKETALEPMRAVAGDRKGDPVQRYDKFMRVWVQGEPHWPRYDLAIRRWALVDPDVSREVRKMDLKRIKLLSNIFHDMGFDPNEAQIRARISYFHQIGYYATDVRYTPRQREESWPIYRDILTRK